MRATAAESMAFTSAIPTLLINPRVPIVVFSIISLISLFVVFVKVFRLYVDTEDRSLVDYRLFVVC